MRLIGRRPAALTGLLVVVVSALVLLAPSSISRAATKTVLIGGAGLDPASLTVVPGTVVTWVNQDGNRHRIRSESGPVEFDSGDLDPGQSFTFTFEVLGTYGYVDDRNKDDVRYHGTVVVSAVATPTPPPPPAGSSPTPVPPTALEVRMAGRAFKPATLTIDAGATVTFINDDGRDHTVTARDGSFDSGVLNPGSRYARTYRTAGTFGYFCAIHPDMTGTIAVRSAGGGAPPPPAPTPVPTPRPSSAPAPPGGVAIIDFDFRPTTITASAGATITWVNQGASLHTVTARDGSFDSGLISAGGTYSRRFPTPGTFLYLCSLHPTMTGTIAISGPGGATPPPPAPPPAATPPPVVPPDAIAVVDFAFRPATITIPVGTRLTWVNTGAAPHTVTSRSALFDSGIVPAGGRYSRIFSAPGTYPYFCSLHPGMTATVLVPGANGIAPPPASPPPAPPVTGPADLRIVDFGYSPQSITVPVGTTLRWINAGVAPHTVTDRGGRFDSGFLSTGDGFSRRFDEVGTFEYFCVVHPEMTGSVTVGEGSGAAPSAAASPSGSGGPPGEGARVSMLDFLFDPPTITVPAGSTLTFVNDGAALHTATATDGTWDTGFVNSGAEASISVPPPGTWTYACTIHPQMVGTLIVLEPGAAGSPPVGGSPGPPGGAAAAPDGSSGPPGDAENLVRFVATMLLVIGAVGLYLGVIRGVAGRADREQRGPIS